MVTAVGTECPLVFSSVCLQNRDGDLAMGVIEIDA